MRPGSPPKPARAHAVAWILLVTVASGGCDDSEPGPQEGSRGEAPPNVLLVTVDSLRADHLGAHDAASPNTPNADRLARSGVRFETAYAHAPIPAPSHASLFLSQLVRDHGVRNAGDALPAEAPTLAGMLDGAGWTTAAFPGRQSVGAAHGFAQGFAHFDDGWARGAWRPARETSDRAIRWLRAQGDDRFFLWVHYADPAAPYVPPDDVTRLTATLDGERIDRFDADGRRIALSMRLSPGEHELELARSKAETPLELVDWHWPKGVDHGFGESWRRQGGRRRIPRGQASAAVTLDHTGEQPLQVTIRVRPRPRTATKARRRRYAAEVAHVDAQLGRLLSTLDELALRDETLVVLTASHGEALGHRGGYFGHADRLYESVIRVPLVLSHPAALPTSKAIAATTRHVDLLPTVAELCGVVAPDGLRGESMLPLGELGQRVAIAETYRPQARADRRAIRLGRYKLVRNRTKKRSRLHDLVLDPAATRDLRELARQRMRKALRASPAKRHAPNKAELSEQEREALRALGYAE